MTTHLNHLLARTRSADFADAAERARIAQLGGSVPSASRPLGLIAHFLIPHQRRGHESELRLRLAQAPTKDCTEDGLPC
jgi:hypothetical protein